MALLALLSASHQAHRKSGAGKVASRVPHYLGIWAAAGCGYLLVGATRVSARPEDESPRGASGGIRKSDHQGIHGRQQRP